MLAHVEHRPLERSRRCLHAGTPQIAQRRVQLMQTEYLAICLRFFEIHPHLNDPSFSPFAVRRSISVKYATMKLSGSASEFCLTFSCVASMVGMKQPRNYNNRCILKAFLYMRTLRSAEQIAS